MAENRAHAERKVNTNTIFEKVKNLVNSVKMRMPNVRANDTHCATSDVMAHLHQKVTENGTKGNF